MVAPIAGLILLAFGAFATATNWLLVVRSVRRRKSGTVVPLLGGLAILGGAALLGSRWGTLLALVDPGVIVVLLVPPHLIACEIREWRATRPPRLPRASLRTRARHLPREVDGPASPPRAHPDRH